MSRQNRLTQLTTQLLWRLQQSSPYHASTTSDLVLPQLPEASTVLGTLPRPSKLLAGLESSRGALYEIGVSDSGVLVGLTEDEMEESLGNLRAMAASLGCVVEVSRMVEVGGCEWQQRGESGGRLGDGIKNLTINGDKKDEEKQVQVRQAKLYVAEALVTPDLSGAKAESSRAYPMDSLREQQTTGSLKLSPSTKTALPKTSRTEQLRVTFTGPTTSGKSSLLGTLSTATLDNGRGKSRLSLLKHRHELVSGVTSSVAQELLGYCSTTPDAPPKIINYRTGNVTTWTDIHASSSRLLFVSDSAGHPKFRRTTVRGLVGWAPHWTLLCIAADDAAHAPHSAGGTYSAQEILGGAGRGVDLLQAHLDLCLKLGRPLGVIITKMDLASKGALRATLTKTLTAIKEAGRVPVMLPPDQTKDLVDSDLETIIEADASPVRKLVASMDRGNLNKVVPVIMTSAANGTGVRMLHALLSSLPLPATPTPNEYVGDTLSPEQPSSLFYVEDTFTLPASLSMPTFKSRPRQDAGTVVAGYLRFGSLSVGDKITVGPFPTDFDSGDEDDFSSSPGDRSNVGESSEDSELARPRSCPSPSSIARRAQRNAKKGSMSSERNSEWLDAKVVSIRNLRLPVHNLEAGQVGTIGVVFDAPSEDNDSSKVTSKLRKGMVLAIPSQQMKEGGLGMRASSRFAATFEDSEVNSVTVGTLVVVYIASIRASARVVRVEPHVGVEPKGDDEKPESFADSASDEEKSLFFGASDEEATTDITLEFMTTREWVELESQVLMMPGGGSGLYGGNERGEKGVGGLEGFVGVVGSVE